MPSGDDLEHNSELLDMVRRRANDEKSMVRKAALQVLTHFTLRQTFTAATI